MWENLKPTDLDRVRHQLALERGVMLSRHAAELKELDGRCDEIETLNQLINAFAEKYGKTNTPSEPQDETSAVLHIEQQVAPSFGTPLRRIGGH